MTPAVITCALTGPIATKADNPNLPTSPHEIAEAARGAYDAGAAVVHVHVRDGLEPTPHWIDYRRLEDTAVESQALTGLGPEYWPDRRVWAVEFVTLSTHAGTHVDAPAHYGPSREGRACTIDEVALAWCFGDGVRLAMTGKDRVRGSRDPWRPSSTASATTSSRSTSCSS